jgi:glutamate racemase
MRIGVFDSGIGGLTVLAALREALPGHDLVYLGDTARIPYGTRSPITVVRYSLAVASHLFHVERVEHLVVACNTASTHALPALREAGTRAGVPVDGVVTPGVEAALGAHRHGGIAVLGTPGTVAGGSYQAQLAERAPRTPVFAVACPLFVPLVEEGWLQGSVPRAVAEAYVGHLAGKVDTAILGCTHYPLLAPVLSEVLPGTHLVDSARATARAVLARVGPGEGPGSVAYRVTDNVERFQQVGAVFLGHVPSPVQWIDLGPARAPFTLGDEDAG